MTTINTNTTSTTAFIVTPDTTGTFVVNTGSGVGATAMTISATQAVTLTGSLQLADGTTTMAPLDFDAGPLLTTVYSGAVEYDGDSLYFTPKGTQRGIVPGMQYYRLNSGLVGANVNTAQNIFGVSVTLSANTVYAFEAMYAFTKTAGTTSHTFGLSFGGAATLNNILYYVGSIGTSTALPAFDTGANGLISNSASNSAISGSITTATSTRGVLVRGTVSINAGGTFTPQYTLSAAPGGAYTTAAGSFFLIYPVGGSGADTSVGTWA